MRKTWLNKLILCSVITFLIGLTVTTVPFSFAPSVYKITPSSCNTTQYEGAPSWFTHDSWKVVVQRRFYGYGFCPNLIRTKKFGHKHHWVYTKCIEFQSTNEWNAIDIDNAREGYNSDLKQAAAKFVTAGLVFEGGFWMGVATLAFSSIARSKGGFYSPVIAMIIFTLGATITRAFLASGLSLMTNTDMTRIQSWSTTFFRTCHVDITTMPGYYCIEVVVAILSAATCVAWFCVIAIILLYCRESYSDQDLMLLIADPDKLAYGRLDGSEHEMQTYNTINSAQIIHGSTPFKLFYEVDVYEARQLLDSPTPPLLIDIREQDEWDAGYLQSATHAPQTMTSITIAKIAPDKATPILLYCSSGARSADAAETLAGLGYTNLKSMAGGFNAWNAAGFNAAAETLPIAQTAKIRPQGREKSAPGSSIPVRDKRAPGSSLGSSLSGRG